MTTKRLTEASQETDEVDDNADSVPDHVPEDEVEEVPGDGPAEVDPATSERATVQDDNVSTPTGSDEESCSKDELCKDSDEHGVDAEESQPMDKSIMNEGSSNGNESEIMEKTSDALSNDSGDGNRRSESKEVCVADIVKACLDSIVERVLLVGSGDESKNSTDDENNDVSHEQARRPISEVQLVSNQHSEESEVEIIQGCLDHILSMVVDICEEDTPTEQHGKHPVVSVPEDREASTGSDPNTIAAEQEDAQSVLNSDQYEAFIDLTKLPEKQTFGLNEHDKRPTAENDVLEDQKEMECQGEDCQIVIDQMEMNSEKIGVVDMTTAEEFEAQKLQSSQEFAAPHAPQSVAKPLEQNDTDISDKTVKEDSTSSHSQALPRNSKVSGLEKGRISIGYSKRKDKYKCFLCHEIGTGRKFEEHVMLHLLWKPYKCLYCSQFFITRASIGTHVSEKHTGQLPKCGLRAIKKAKQFLAEAHKKGTCEYLSEKLNDMYWTCMRRKKSDGMGGMEDFEEDQDAVDGKNVSCDYVDPVSPGESISVNEIQPRSEDFAIKTSPSTSTIHTKSIDAIAPIIVPDADDIAPLEPPEATTSVCPIQRKQLSNRATIMDDTIPIIVPDTDDAALESLEKKTNAVTYPLLMSTINDPIEDGATLEYPVKKSNTPVSSILVQQLSTPRKESIMQIIVPDTDDTATLESPVKNTNILILKEQPSHAFERVAKVVPVQRDRPTASASALLSPQQLTSVSQIQSPVHQLTIASHIQSPAQQLTSPIYQLTSASQIQSPAQQLTSASQIRSQVHQLTSASHIQSPAQRLIQSQVHQLTSASHIQSPAQQLTSPFHQLTSASQIQSPVQQLTNTSQRSPVHQLTSASQIQRPAQQLMSASQIKSLAQQLTSASLIQIRAEQLTNASQRSPVQQLTSASQIRSPAQQLTSASQIRSPAQQLTSAPQIWNSPILTSVSHILSPVPVLTTAVLPHPQAPKSVPTGSYIILSGNQMILPSTFVPNVQLQTSCIQPRQDMNVIRVPMPLAGQATVTVNQTPPPNQVQSLTIPVSQQYKKDIIIKKLNHPKKFSICIMNDYFLCNLCKSKFAQESTFRAHLWNHIHMWKLLCSFCSSSTSKKGWKTLSCSKTDDYIEKLKRDKVAMSSVVEVHLDDEDSGDKQGEAHSQQRNMIEQQAASQASVDKPEMHVEEAISLASSRTVEHIADEASVTARGDGGCQSGKTKAVSILLSEGAHSEGNQDQAEYGPGNARAMIISENQPLPSHQYIITAAINVASTQSELPSEILRVQKTASESKDLNVLRSDVPPMQETASQSKDLDVLRSDVPPMQETVSQSKDLDVQRSDKTVGSTISQESSSTEPTRPKFYACGAACGYSTLFGTELKKHVDECKWPGALLCSHCKFKADSPDVLVRHMGKHYLAHLPGVAVFQCSVSSCNFATNILQGFVHHLRNVHPNLDRYTCHFCDECFTEPQPLLRHLHSNILHVVNCKYCSAKDSNKAVIIKHIMESHPEKSKVTNMVKQLLCKDRKENATASRCVLEAHATLQVTVPTSLPTSYDDSRADHFSDISHPLPRGHAGSQITGSNRPTMLSAFIPTAGIVTNTPIIDQTASQNTARKNVSHPYKVTCCSETSLSCQICSFVGKNESELNVHASKHKARPSPRMLSFSCPECPEDFNMIDSFQTHLKKHNEAIAYDVSCCRICQMEKGSRQNVLNHIKAVHNPIGDGREFVQSVFKTSNSDVVMCSSCQYTCLGTEAMSIHHQKQTYSPGTGTTSQCPDQISKSPVATFCESFAPSRIGYNQKPKVKVTMAIPSNSVYKYPVCCIICTYSSVYKANLQRHMDRNHPEVDVTMEEGGIASPTKMRNVPRDVPSDASDFQESDVDKLKIGGSFLAKELEWLYEDHGSVYRCLKCHKDFHRKNIIHAHVLSHWNISLWKCATCSYKHARRVMVMEHMKQEHNKDCNMDDIIPLIDSLRKDISSIVGTLVENGRIIQDMAPILGSKYLDSKFRHMYKTVGKKRLCKGCEAEYQSTYDMHRHILKTHIELSLFKCSYCNFSSIERLSVVEHISKEHPQEDVVVCYMPCTTHKIKMRKKKATSRSSSKDSERERHLADSSKVTSVKKIAHNKNKPKNKSPAAEVELQSDQPEKNVTESDSDFSNGNMSQLGKTSAPSPLSPLTKRTTDSRDGRDELRVGSNTLDQKLQRLYDGKSSRNRKMVCNVCKQDFPSKYSLHCHLLAHLKINLLACPYCNFEQVEKSKVVCHVKSNHPDDHVHLRHIKVDIDETVQEFIGDRSRFGRKKKARKEVRLSQILAGRTSMKSPRKLSKSPEKQSKNVVAVKVGDLRKYKCRLCDYMALTKNSVGTHVFKVHENPKTKTVADELHGVSASETVSTQTSKKGKVPTRTNKKSNASPQTSKKSSVAEKKGSACTDSKLSNKGEQLERKKSTDTSDAESTSSSGITESEKKVDSHAKKSQVEEADMSEYFRCPKCSFADSQRDKVLSHMKSKHSVTNVLSCKYCDAWFFTMNSLKGHISFLHKGKDIRFITMLLEDVTVETPSKDSSSKSAVKRPSSDDGKSSKDCAKRAKKSSKSLFTSEDEMKTNSKAATTSVTTPPKQEQGNSTSKEKHLSSEDVCVKSKCIEEDGASLKSQDTSSSTQSKTSLNTPPKDATSDSSEQTVAGNSELSSCVPSSPDNSGDEQTEYYKYLCVYCEFKTSSTLEMKYHIAGHQTERSFSGKVPENDTDKEKIKKKVSAILPICKERAKNKLINLSPSQVSTENKKPEVACAVTPIKSNTDLPAGDGPFIQKSASISVSQTSPSKNRLSLKRNRHSPVAAKTGVKHKKDNEPSCSSDSSSESEDSEMIQPRKLNKSRLIVSSDEETSDEEDEKPATPKKKPPSPSKINYCCHLCPFMGRSLYQFRSHLASHGGFTHLNPDISKDSMLTCGFCGFMTESKDHFADHVEKHLSGGIYKCGYCKFDSYHRKNMKSHLNCRHRHKPEKFVDLRVLMRERAQRTWGTANLVNLDPQLRLVDSMISLQFKRLLDEAGCETMSMPLSVVKVVYQLIGGNIEGISDDEFDM